MSTYTIPSVVERTVRGELAVDVYSRLLTDRIVYIGTEIDDGVANVVIAQLLHLESDSPSSPINLYLNSPGGSVTAMLAIYDTMQFVSSPVGTTQPRRRSSHGSSVCTQLASTWHQPPGHRWSAAPVTTVRTTPSASSEPSR